MSIDVGAKAPDFALPNQDRETVRLSEVVKKGPVVLAFLPGAFSGTCTAEMCSFRDSSPELGKTGRADHRRQHRHVLCPEGLGRSAEVQLSAAQ